MKLSHIIQRVQSAYSHGLQSKDSRLTSRHIYSAIGTARNILLSQQYNKGQRINQWAYQTLPCIELIKAAIHECAGLPKGSLVLRSKHKVPKPVTGIDKHLIKSVTSLDGLVRFDEGDFETDKYMRGNKYTSTKPDYYFRNEYIYVTVLKELRIITVTGVFDDVIAAKQFPSLCGCSDCECEDIIDMEYPIDGDLEDALIKIAVNELIIILKQLGEDRQANASDDTGTVGLVHTPQS